MITTKPRPRQGLSRVTALLAVAGAALVVVAAPAGAADDRVVTEVSAADRAAALAHWTPERMRQWVGDDSLPPAEKIGREWEGPVPAGVGRLFFTAEPGVDESCTATVVPSSSKDVALTAGHCVNGGPDRSRKAGGEALFSCARPATLEVNSVTTTWNTDCDLAGGSSGGPWLRNFDPATGKGTIFSVTSRGTLTEDGVTTDLSGAAFTDPVRALYERAGEL
jgi:hypothetical protein